MSTFLGVPADAAYHLVFALASFLTPALGGLAAAAAIALFTIAVRLLLVPLSFRALKGLDAQARLAPKVAELRQRYAGQPEALQRALVALYQSEGTSAFAGCLPLLLQWPFFSVMYLVFRSPVIGGVRNALLSRDLLTAPLGSHWLSAAGPFSTQGAVFAGLFLLLALIGWLGARLTRKLAASSEIAAKAAGAARATVPAGAAGADGVTGAAGTAATALTRALPYLTVAFAAFLPLASGLYLVTTSAWTLAERAILLRRLHPPLPA